MSRNIDIQQRVEQHYDFVCSQYNEDHVLGVFLYGSQNYDLDCFNSDVDTKDSCSQHFFKNAVSIPFKVGKPKSRIIASKSLVLTHF